MSRPLVIYMRFGSGLEGAKRRALRDVAARLALEPPADTRLCYLRCMLLAWRLFSARIQAPCA